MISRTKVLGALAAPALFLSLAGGRPAVAAIDIGTCAKVIYTEAGKTQTAALKGFQACDALYRKAQVVAKKAGTAPDYVVKGTTTGCQAKLLAATGTLSKEITTLVGKVGKNCDDSTLLMLGHLPPSKFGDNWARAVVMGALNHAYQMEIVSSRDTIKMFQDLSCAPKETGPQCLPTHTPACALCETFAKSPCYEHSCTYLSPGSSQFHLVSSTGFDIPGDLLGSTGFTLCQFPGVSAGADYIVLGGAAGKGIKPVDLGIGHACPIQQGAEGYINCGGSGALVNYSTCQDSKLNAVTDNPGGCTAAITPDVCTSATTDTQDGGINGGGCVKFNLAGASSGAGFIVNTTQLNVPLSGQEGPDGQPCTNDDTVAPASSNSIELTTGSADSQVLNFGTDTPGGTATSGSVTGHAFTCGNIQSSNLSGGKIAGAFPAAGQPTLDDSTTTFTIGCE